MNKNNNNIPHLFCLIMGYITVSILFIITAAFKISAEVLLSSWSNLIAFLVASYLMGYFIWKTK